MPSVLGHEAGAAGITAERTLWLSIVLAHVQSAFPSPGAEWRDPPHRGLEGSRQGLASPPHEEQEVPGRSGCH